MALAALVPWPRPAGARPRTAQSARAWRRALRGRANVLTFARGGSTHKQLPVGPLQHSRQRGCSSRSRGPVEEEPAPAHTRWISRHGDCSTRWLMHMPTVLFFMKNSALLDVAVVLGDDVGATWRRRGRGEAAARGYGGAASSKVMPRANYDDESISIAHESSRASCCLKSPARAHARLSKFIFCDSSGDSCDSAISSSRAFRWYLVYLPAPTGSPFTCPALVCGRR